MTGQRTRDKILLKNLRLCLLTARSVLLIIIVFIGCICEQCNLDHFFSECPNNITLMHNASAYAVGTVSPLNMYDNLPLYFNQSTAVAFECNFETIYSDITIFMWYVDRIWDEMKFSIKQIIKNLIGPLYTGILFISKFKQNFEKKVWTKNFQCKGAFRKFNCTCFYSAPRHFKVF